MEDGHSNRVGAWRGRILGTLVPWTLADCSGVRRRGRTHIAALRRRPAPSAFRRCVTLQALWSIVWVVTVTETLSSP